MNHAAEKLCDFAGKPARIQKKKKNQTETFSRHGQLTHATTQKHSRFVYGHLCSGPVPLSHLDTNQSTCLNRVMETLPHGSWA